MTSLDARGRGPVMGLERGQDQISGVWVLFIFRAVGSIEVFKQQVTASDVALGGSLGLLGGGGT